MNKNYSKLIIGLFLLNSLILIILSCQKEESNSDSISDIFIKSAPSKIEYLEGEYLDLSGLVITISMKNGKTEDIYPINFADRKIECYPADGSILTEEFNEVVIKHIETGKFITLDISFITLIDMDGTNYPLVRIGNQIWMAENLRTTKFKNGEAIPLIDNNTDWINKKSPAYGWYENDSSKYSYPYGALYNWYAVGSGNLSPDGWRVPSKEDWNELIEYLGGKSIAGGKMKCNGFTYWEQPNTGATNESGFSALPGGCLEVSEFSNLGVYGYWWTSSKFDLTTAGEVILLYFSSEVLQGDWQMYSAESVRLIKD